IGRGSGRGKGGNFGGAGVFKKKKKRKGRIGSYSRKKEEKPQELGDGRKNREWERRYETGVGATGGCACGSGWRRAQGVVGGQSVPADQRRPTSTNVRYTELTGPCGCVLHTLLARNYLCLLSVVGMVLFYN